MKIQNKLIVWWATVCAIAIASCIAVTVVFGQGIVDREGEPPAQVTCCDGCRAALHSMASHHVELLKKIEQLEQELAGHKHPHTHMPCKTCSSWPLK